jgi:Pectate lyase superfamily protein
VGCRDGSETYENILPTLGLMRGGVPTSSGQQPGARPPRLICASLVISLILAACTDSDTEATSTTATTATEQPTDATTTTPQQQIELPDLASPEVVFPDDSGVVNVVEDYGARGDGVTDDTEAIRRAIEENVGRSRILYFPAGTYLVSDSLEWRDGEGVWQPFLTFQGQGRDLTVIRLDDGAEGFGDPAQPRGVIVTGSGLFNGEATAGGKDYEGLGEGNEAFRNFIFDLTIDTGVDNPGAVGVDLLANNNGGMVNVTIRSEDGQGAVGLSMIRRWPGPALIKNVQIEGFDYGVKTAHTEYGLTFEHLALVDQRVAGIHNDGNVLSIRKLTSQNSVPAIENVSPQGLVVLVQGELGGGAPEVSAIENEAHLYVREVETYGYQSAISGTEGASVSEFSTSNLIDESSISSSSSLGLPIEETPVVSSTDLNDWANVTDTNYAGGANPYDNEDDTTAIQAALDSGNPTIYFPSAGQPWEGRYLVGDTLVVPPSVERILGMESFLAPVLGNNFQDPSQPRPLIRIEGGEAGQVVSLERFRFGRHEAELPGMIWIEHASPRTAVVRHVILGGSDHIGYLGLPESGPLFLEDYCCSNIHVDDTQGVWARQLNLERDKLMVRNQATPLWILGIKTEFPATVIETSGGGETEVLGGLLYPAREVSSDTPAFMNLDSRHSLIYAVSAYVTPTNNYAIQIQETDDGLTSQLLTTEALQRDLGSIVIR